MKREEIGKKEGKTERNMGDIVKTVDRARSGRSIKELSTVSLELIRWKF